MLHQAVTGHENIKETMCMHIVILQSQYAISSSLYNAYSIYIKADGFPWVVFRSPDAMPIERSYDYN